MYWSPEVSIYICDEAKEEALNRCVLHRLPLPPALAKALATEFDFLCSCWILQLASFSTKNLQSLIIEVKLSLSIVLEQVNWDNRVSFNFHMWWFLALPLMLDLVEWWRAQLEGLKPMEVWVRSLGIHCLFLTLCFHH